MISPFKFWCQKVLPLVYDDSLSYYEVLCKMANYINSIILDLQILTGKIEEIDDNIESITIETVNNLFYENKVLVDFKYNEDNESITFSFVKED